MRWLRRLIVRALLTGAVFCGAASHGAELRMQFLRALQQSKYADVALDYLDQLEAQKDVPARFRETLDLERCNTYLAWSRLAANAQQAEQRRSQGHAYLKKFLASHPGHPSAAMVTAFTGGMSLERGEQLLASARRTEDSPRQASLRREGAAALEDARQKLGEAAAQYRRWLKLLSSSAPGAPPDRRAEIRAERSDVELAAAEVNFKLGAACYGLAEAHADPKSAACADLLKQAAEQFDLAYQQLRNTNPVAALWAHLWQARVVEAQGDTETTQDILDEVLAGMPIDHDTPVSDLAPLYCEATLLQLQRSVKQGKPERFIEDAGSWLRLHKSWARLPAAQRIVIEMAKVRHEQARVADDRERRKLLQQAADMLDGPARIEGEHKAEAIRLRRQIQKELGVASAGIEESLALGDAALAAQALPEAAEHYRRALAAVKDKNPKQVADIQLRINRVRYAQAVALYAARKYDEALAAAEQLARENHADPSCAKAASLALSSSLSQFAAAADKPAALPRLQKIVAFVAQQWTGQPEADEAFITLGQAYLLQGDVDRAMAEFQHVRPTSRRYPGVLLMQGQVHWKAYNEEQKKAEAARNAQRLQTERAAALQCVRQAAERLQNETSLSTMESAAPLIDAFVLLAELLAENKEYAPLVAQLDPVIAKVEILKPQPLDKATFRLFLAGVRAHMALGHIKQAAEMTLTMIELSADRTEFNEVLVNVAKLLRGEFKRVDAAMTEAPASVPGAYQQAAAKREEVKQLLLKVLKPLLNRRNYSAGDMAYLGDLCTALELNDQAMQQYQRLVQHADADPDFARSAGRALIGAKAQVVGLLRTQGKFAEAVKASDDLIAKAPRSIEPRLVKARILEDWAQQDATKYAAAVTQWTEVRVLLGHLPRKPAEYYQAIYHTAACLYGQWQTSQDAALLAPAQQALQSTMILDSKAIDSELLAQYKDLLKRVESARERAKARSGN